MHVLQGISKEVAGTRLYRGLGGLDVHDFVASRGFAEKAFMSTTKSLKVALEYSGVKQGPLFHLWLCVCVCLCLRCLAAMWLLVCLFTECSLWTPLRNAVIKKPAFIFDG